MVCEGQNKITTNLLENETSHRMYNKNNRFLRGSAGEWTCNGDICTIPTFKSLPSLPNFIPKRSALAKSKILDRLFGPLDLKSALYPKVRILAVLISGSSGSHSWGQNVSRALFKVQVLRLDPPSPCTKMMSTECGVDGAYRTLSPIASGS